MPLVKLVVCAGFQPEITRLDDERMDLFRALVPDAGIGIAVGLRRLLHEVIVALGNVGQGSSGDLHQGGVFQGV